jgi:hypothetical protein
MVDPRARLGTTIDEPERNKDTCYFDVSTIIDYQRA